MGERILLEQPAEKKSLPTKSYLLPLGSLIFTSGRTMAVRCHQCQKRIKGDWSTPEAEVRRHNFFTCDCGEWQEWVLPDVARSRWKLFDFSKVWLKNQAEDNLKAWASFGLYLKMVPTDLRIGPKSTAILAFGTDPDDAEKRVIKELESPKPAKLQKFDLDGLTSAINYPKNTRPAKQSCASCGTLMEVHLWNYSNIGRYIVAVNTPNGPRKTIYHTIYHCPVCLRDDVYMLGSPTTKTFDVSERWLIHAATFWPSDKWRTWRAPDAILTCEPIKAVGIAPDEMPF